MIKYESFLERFDEIELIKDEDEQFDAFCKLDKDVLNWLHEKYPELQDLYLEELSDELANTERQFVENILKTYFNIYDLLDLVGLNETIIIDKYLNSKLNDN